MSLPRSVFLRMAALCVALVTAHHAPAANQLQPFLESHCLDCHDAETKKGSLDLTALPWNPADPNVHERWVRIFDRVQAGEMPPKRKTPPPIAERDRFVGELGTSLREVSKARQQA